MQAYIQPIKTALIIFPIISAVITFPFMIYQYHKYGAIPWQRSLLIFSFIYYLLTAYLLIILPLPDRSNAALFSFSKHFELVPFSSIFRYFQNHPLSLTSIISFFYSRTILELVFNILLTVPFGIYLRYYFKCSLKKTLLISFCLSLFFELTQLSGLYGIYPAAYRTFDTMDLINNTLGGMIGYYLCPVILFFMPSRQAIDQKAIDMSVKVTLLRRLIATGIDFGSIMIVVFTVRIICYVFGLYDVDFSVLDQWILFIYLWVCACASGGLTPGKKVCNLKLVDNKGGSCSLGKISLRYLIISLQIVGLVTLNYYLQVLLSGSSGVLQIITYCIGLLVWFSTLVFPIEVLIRLFKKNYVFLYEKLSKTQIVSTVKAHEKIITK